MIRINPYLTFNGNCREAMDFYKSCFGGNLTLQTVAETPLAAQCPAGTQNHIMHSELIGEGFVFMATDMQGPNGFNPGNDMALSLYLEDEEKTRSIYSRLKADGKVIDELKNAAWGALFGVVQDPFGKVWMMNCKTE